MANSISGTCGSGSATLYYTSNVAGGVGTTVALSGAYSFTGLASGTYYIVPQVLGQTFTPHARTVVITSTDVTGVDFTQATASTPIPIWSKLGPTAITADGITIGGLEPSVIYETGSQCGLGAGKVLKCWYTSYGLSGGQGVAYTESLDGKIWLAYSTTTPVIAGYLGGAVFKDPSGTYNYYGLTNYFHTPFD